jgi:hypothetical protein
MFDFGITDNGELIFDGPAKSIEKCKDDGLIRQTSLCRIKSVVGDWYNTNIGANLEQFLGEYCDQQTATEITSAIEGALCNDGFLIKSELFFVPKVEDNSISVLVFINSRLGNKPSMINVTIDIVGGVKVQYDPYK